MSIKNFTHIKCLFFFCLTVAEVLSSNSFRRIDDGSFMSSVSLMVEDKNESCVSGIMKSVKALSNTSSTTSQSSVLPAKSLNSYSGRQSLIISLLKSSMMTFSTFWQHFFHTSGVI